MRQKRYYKIVRDVIAHNIATGQIPKSTRLYVAAVADLLALSRPPVLRALDELVAEGILTPHPQQGYIVGSADEEVPVARENLHLLDLDLSHIDTGGTTLVSPRWEAIYDEVERVTLDTIPFGTFQLSETGICDHFGVSRTVAREVLVRLNSRGLIEKNRSSHWIAEPLSAQRLDDAHQIRRQLEPLALADAVGRMSRPQLVAMHAALAAAKPGIGSADFEQLETDLHTELPELCRNRRIVEILEGLRFAQVVNRLFRQLVGHQDERNSLTEHRLVFEHLLADDAEGAAQALRRHLDHDHQRSRDRLKVLSIFEPPPPPSYLSRIH